MEGWLARDSDGSLCFYHDEPYKSSAGFWKCGEDDICGIYVDKVDETEETKKISWEDEQATKVKLLFKIQS